VGFNQDKPLTTGSLSVEEAEHHKNGVVMHYNTKISEIRKGEKRKVKSVVIDGYGEV